MSLYKKFIQMRMTKVVFEIRLHGHLLRLILSFALLLFLMKSSIFKRQINEKGFHDTSWGVRVILETS